MMQKRVILQGKYFFKKFSRKKFSAFNSMRRVVHISNLVLAYSLIVSPIIVSAQDDSITFSKLIEIEELEIIGQLSPAVSEELSGLVTIISASESEQSPVHSITDILRYAGNVDLRQRGKGGIQSDLSIRGGSFDHSLILLNGINLSDPQTGHLSLNLPIETESLHHIEILNGSSSRVHGANAFSGAVNFVTQPSAINSFNISSGLGEYGYFTNSASLNVSLGKVHNLLHYNNAHSSGYVSNTDYFRQGFFYHNQTEIDKNQLEIQFGYNSRAFGSNSFYTPKYPDQFEYNQLLFASLGYETGGRIKIHPQVYWRRHKDRWEMFREDEKWYRVEDGRSISNDTSITSFDTASIYTNHHINDVYGLKLNLSTKTGFGTTSIGWHLRSENIISTNLGFDQGLSIPVRGYDDLSYTLSDGRSIVDMHIEQTLTLWRFYISGGTLINWNSYLSKQVNFYPGVDLKFRIFGKLSLTGSYNYTLGLPTFTDLHYKGLNNQGDTKLKTYSQHSFEGGFKWHSDNFLFSTIGFYTKGKDVIDWIWFAADEKFHPKNIDKYSSSGLELNGQVSANEGSLLEKFVRTAHISFTFIDMDKKIPGDVMKYFNLRSKAALILQSEPVNNLIVALNMSYTNREGSYLNYNSETEEYFLVPFKSYFLTDLRLTYIIKNISIYAEATNLFNADYIDIGSIEQPGRWISGGIKYSIVDF